MIVLGLTGSIGMGKSTTAAMFRDIGVKVHDADATVHGLYAGEAVPVVEALFPGTVVDGKVDRGLLSARVIGNPQAMKQLETAIHPMVHAQEKAFLENAKAAGEKLVVLDIPLLFETGGENRVDGVVVVTAEPEVQERRVLARPGMSLEKFAAIKARQMPDEQKRQKADFLVFTDFGLDSARARVGEIVAEVISGKWEPKRRRFQP